MLATIRPYRDVDVTVDAHAHDLAKAMEKPEAKDSLVVGVSVDNGPGYNPGAEGRYERKQEVEGRSGRGSRRKRKRRKREEGGG